MTRRILPRRSAVNFRRDGLDAVHRELGPQAQLAEATLREIDEVEPQQRVVCSPGELVGGRIRSSDDPAFSVAFCRSSSSQACRSRAIKVAITSSSAAVTGAGSGGGVTPAFCSTSFSMSISILVARALAPAD
jgi:hypothetical protein